MRPLSDPRPRRRLAATAAIVASLVCSAHANSSTGAVRALTPRVAEIQASDGSLSQSLLESIRHQRAALAAYASGDRLFVVARHAGEGLVLSGSLEGEMTPLSRSIAGPDVWLIAFEVEELDVAILDLMVFDGGSFVGYRQFRGAALPPRELDAPLKAGRLIEEEFQSTALGAKRKLSVYVPASGDADLPMVLLLDRGVATKDLASGVDLLIAQGVIRPVIIVMPGPAPHESVSGRTLRGREFLAGLDAQAYERHARYIYDEVMPSVARRFRGSEAPGDRIVAGASAAAVWVMNEAVRNPGRAKIWLAASLPPDVSLSALPVSSAGSIYLGAGTLEPEVAAASLATCQAINHAAGRCRFLMVHGGHTQGAWAALLERVLAEWIPARRGAIPTQIKGSALHGIP